MKKFSVLLVLILIVLIQGNIVNCDSEHEGEWVDPFRFDFIEPIQDKPTAFPRQDKTCDAPSSDVMAYYKRTINLILAAVITENSDPNTYKGRLFVDIPVEDYTFLKKFATANTEEPLTLQEVDHILTKVLTKSTIDELSDLFVYWSDYFYFVFFNRATGVYITMLTVLIVIYKLLKASYTPCQVVIYLMLLGYLIDFVFTWKRMMQELEINKYADSLKYVNVPAGCKLTDNMSAWSVFLSYISSAEKCKEYHKVILSDVFWDVGPLDVIAHQSRVTLTVASNMGMAISKLTTGLMSDLPFPLNILLLPFLLIFVLILLMAILTYLIPTHLDLNILHLISIKLKTNKPIADTSESGQRAPRKEVEELKRPSFVVLGDTGDGNRFDKYRSIQRTEDPSVKESGVENIYVE